MTDLAYWPPRLPVPLAALPAQIANELGVGLSAVDSLPGLEGVEGALLLVLGGDELGHLELLPTLDRVIDGRRAPTVIVIGDGWIGTDGPALESALVGAAAVSLARSIAARRLPTGRVNIVCVPEALLGEAGSQRGPLTLDIDSAAVSQVAAFALGEESSYIDGQVLYANGGRQLFSSLTA